MCPENPLGIGVCQLIIFICTKSDWDGDIIPLPTNNVPMLLTIPQQETITNTVEWMKKNAYEPSTRKYTAKRLRHLMRNTKFDDPENVKTFIANKKCSNAFKECLIETYAIYMRSIDKEWNQPFYDRYDKAIKVPTEEKIDMLIARCETRMSLILSMMKDLGT
jgi:hypothetical protein